MSYLPPVRSRHRVCVICEGYEDYHYFKRLMDLNVWDSAYSFTPINVKSASNIPARFQNEFQNDRYEIILVFCDTDKEPYREYALVKAKINRFLGRRRAAEKVIIFANHFILGEYQLFQGRLFVASEVLLIAAALSER